MPVDFYMVLVQDYGEVYEYPYESIEAAQGFMGRCNLACTLWAYMHGKRQLLCEQAAS